jgi:hypothetical protein
LILVNKALNRRSRFIISRSAAKKRSIISLGASFGVPGLQRILIPGKPIIGDIILEEGVLHIESDYVIYIRPVKDSGKKIVFYDLIAHRIRYNT